MATFSLQLHEALDGTSFSTKADMEAHNLYLKNEAVNELKDMIEEYFVDPTMQVFALRLLIQNKSEIIELFKLID